MVRSECKVTEHVRLTAIWPSDLNEALSVATSPNPRRRQTGLRVDSCESVGSSSHGVVNEIDGEEAMVTREYWEREDLLGHFPAGGDARRTLERVLEVVGDRAGRAYVNGQVPVPVFGHLKVPTLRG